MLVRTPNLGNPWHQKTKHMSGGNAMEKLDSAKYFTKELLLLLLSCFSRVRLCAIPEMAAHWAPLSLGFSRQEHWSGCHFLLQWMKVKSESEVVQSCPTPSDPMDCSLPGSSKYFGHLMRRVDSLEKTLMLGGIGGRKRRGDRG